MATGAFCPCPTWFLMQKSFSIRELVALAVVGFCALPALAQDPAPAEATRGRATLGFAREPRRPRPSPQDRRIQLEARLREMMQSFGVSAPATQDAIVDYLAEEEAGRLAVREAARRLLNGLRRDAPPERMRDLISSYQTALATDSKRRQTAQTTLDAKIGFSFDTRLEALLWLSGVLGEGGSALPMGALSMRAGTPRAREGELALARTAKRDTARRGQLIGTLENKAPGWIEVRGESGALERFWPAWNDELAAFEPRVVATMEQLPLGARVRVEWQQFERRRIVDLAAAPDPKRPAMPDQAPTQTGEAEARNDAPQPR